MALLTAVAMGEFHTQPRSSANEYPTWDENNQLVQVTDEYNYQPPCSVADNTDIFEGEGRYRTNISFAAQLCGSCLVRLECVATDMQEIIGGGWISATMQVGYRGGLCKSSRLTLARSLRAAGIQSVTVDDVEGRLGPPEKHNNHKKSA